MVRRLAILLLMSLALACLGGCFNRTTDEQAVPWGRPASWEDRAPGFGGGGGGGGL